MKVSTWPYFSREEINNVGFILDSGKVNYWTGNETKKFEKEFTKFSNTSYSIALANGSLALHAAYLSVGLSKGSEFITSPRTFIATTSTGVLLGGIPKFADVDLKSGCITAETIEPLINSKTKAISVVHFGGWPADMESICRLASSYNIPVIEDCAQAHGASIKINGEFKSVGSFGDVAAWSFCQDKIISTGGEGGMISTNKKIIHDQIWSYKDHGKSLEKVNKKDHPVGFRWLHDDFGTNFRITEIQSAIGLYQLGKIKEWNQIRTKNAEILANKLKKLSIVRISLPPENLRHAWYKFYCYLNDEALSDGWTRDRIINEINDQGFPAFHGGCSEIYLEESFKKYGFFPEKRLKNARKLGETSLMFLVHPTITKEQMENYSNLIKEVLIKATKS
tara:strand:- start:1932 stop:3113 length:1182 start_codon:yes stop_codon:yes gene_type:complete